MAELEGKRTNHSLHATGPTRMYQVGMDGKLVQELTGHRSNAVLEYKHTLSQMKIMSVKFFMETKTVMYL